MNSKDIKNNWLQFGNPSSNIGHMGRRLPHPRPPPSPRPRPLKVKSSLKMHLGGSIFQNILTFGPPCVGHNNVQNLRISSPLLKYAVRPCLVDVIPMYLCKFVVIYGGPNPFREGHEQLDAGGHAQVREVQPHRPNIWVHHQL